MLRLEWARLNRELRRQKDAELAVLGTDADIEEALQSQQQQASRQPADDIDDMMVDAIAREEEAEIEALLSSMPQPPTQTDEDGDRDMDEGRPERVYFSDDEDYDALFMELSQQEQPSRMGSSQDTEMA